MEFWEACAAIKTNLYIINQPARAGLSSIIDFIDVLKQFLFVLILAFFVSEPSILP